MTRTAAASIDRRRHSVIHGAKALASSCRNAGRFLKSAKGRIVREGKTAAILSLGGRLQESMKAAEELAARGLSTTVADARFVKPLDDDMIRELARNHEVW